MTRVDPDVTRLLEEARPGDSDATHRCVRALLLQVLSTEP